MGAVEPEEYAKLVVELMAFLDGDTKPVVDRLETEMREAAGELEFERAARLRDRLATVRLAVERQQMVTETPEDLDAIAMAEDELAAAVQVFHVRRGRVVGRHGFIVEKVEPLTTAQLSHGCSSSTTPRLRSGSPASCSFRNYQRTSATYEAWLSGLVAERSRSGCPNAAASASLSATARQNAEEQLSATACGGRATSRAAPPRSRNCSRLSSWNKRRCGSSATT